MTDRDLDPHPDARALWQRHRRHLPAPTGDATPDLMDLAAYAERRLHGPARARMEAALAADGSLLALVRAAQTSDDAAAAIAPQLAPVPAGVMDRAKGLVRPPSVVRDSWRDRIGGWFGALAGGGARQAVGAMAMAALVAVTGVGAFDLGQETYRQAAVTEALLAESLPVGAILTEPGVDARGRP